MAPPASAPKSVQLSGPSGRKGIGPCLCGTLGGAVGGAGTDIER